MSAALMVEAAESYLRSRTGCYAYRAIRYRAAAIAMAQMGLSEESLVVDVGAGWTELDFCLRCEFGFRGRYHPVDGNLDGTDLEHWEPPRRADFFVALELLEHLERPERLLRRMVGAADRGVVVSVPNPRTTNVLGMDETHKTVVTLGLLEDQGMTVREESFYGAPADSLFATLKKRER